ncbi:MAG: quinone oxidoreductase family protein [Solirubrobacteraceae bacterium]
MGAPALFRALRIHALGEPPRLEMLPLPAPGAGEALVRLEATVISHFDLGAAAGVLSVQQPLPLIPGLEGAGRVEAVGGDSGLAPGTRVRVYGEGLGIVRPGTWGEAVLAPLTALMPLPETLDFAPAAACGSVLATAWAALFELGRVAPGESIGVTGATGAVGTLVAQLALREAGRRVVAWAREPARLVPGVEPLGYEEDPAQPVDVLVDTIGGAGLLRRLQSVRRGGRAVLLGYTAGERICVDLPALLSADVALLPLNMRRRRVAAHVLEQLVGDVAQGRLAVPLQTIGVDELANGIAGVKAGTIRGRLILTWRDARDASESPQQRGDT